MDPLTIGGLVVGILSIILTLVAWLRPRPPAPPAPSSAETQTSPQPAAASDGLKVTVSQGFLTFPPPQGLSEPMLFIEAVNPTSRLYQVVGVGFDLEGTGSKLVMLRPESVPSVPCRLAETESLKCWAPLRELGLELVRSGIARKTKIRGWVQDSYDAKHMSDWRDFDPVEWSQYQRK
jgi:hypothetical protein